MVQKATGRLAKCKRAALYLKNKSEAVVVESINLETYREMTSPKAKSKAKAKEQARKLAELTELNLINLPGHKKEFRFHPVRRWRFDYAWPEIKIALEIHGGVFTNGRHTRGKGFTEDKVKMNTAQLLGWIVIEATTVHVNNGQMLKWVTEAIAFRGNNASD